MKVGLIARAEDRGLGVLSWEWYRHVQPDRTLVVVPDAVQKAGLTSHLDWYPDGKAIRFKTNGSRTLGVGELDEAQCRRWLRGLDVVYAAETLYDWRLARWAAEEKVATVVHAMPEFMRPEWFTQPTQWWAPTSYRLSLLPPSARVVPVPIPTDRWKSNVDHGTSTTNVTLRWLHVAGAETIRDRNGTTSLLRAIRFCEQRHLLAISTQTGIGDRAVPNDVPNVDVYVRHANVANYWEIYEGFDAMVMPRRYAGLCLPVLEAMGAGLPVLMSDMPPQNEEWPVAVVQTARAAPLQLSGGRIETGDVDPIALARAMDRWARHPDELDAARERTARWVDEHSWKALLPTIMDELERARALL